MKRRKTFSLLLVFALFFGVLAFFTSCEDPIPPRPDCEINQYGSVIVKNATGYLVTVDVTWGSISTNYEKMLYNNDSYKYSHVPAGGIEIWISFGDNDWAWNNEYLSACEDMTYTWYLSGKKGIGESPFVLDIGNGELVTPTLR